MLQHPLEQVAHMLRHNFKLVLYQAVMVLLYSLSIILSVTQQHSIIHLILVKENIMNTITTVDPTPCPKPGEPGFWEWHQTNNPPTFPKPE